MTADGSVQLRALALRLRAAGEGGLLREMTAGMREAAGPLIESTREAARAQLPHEGGLNEYVAGEKISVSVRTGLRTAGVRLLARTPALAQTDAGFVRHPTWGHRGPGYWTTQQIPEAAGWWSHTLADGSPVVTPRLLAVMAVVGARIQYGGG